jgi:hypothetical protein
MVPILEGMFNISSGTWQGRWGMCALSEEDFKNGNTGIAREESSEFEFKTQVQEPALGLGAGGGQGPPLPVSGLYDGYFMVKQSPPDPVIRVDEKDVHLEFKQAASSASTAAEVIEVIGSGKNMYGNFALRGWMNASGPPEHGLWSMRLQKRWVVVKYH